MEIKLREQTLFSYVGKKRGQLDAILRYAANHQQFHVAAFIALTKGKNTGNIRTARALLKEAALLRHTTVVVVSLQSANRYKGK